MTAVSKAIFPDHIADGCKFRFAHFGAPNGDSHRRNFTRRHRGRGEVRGCRSPCWSNLVAVRQGGLPTLTLNNCSSADPLVIRVLAGDAGAEGESVSAWQSNSCCLVPPRGGQQEANFRLLGKKPVAMRSGGKESSGTMGHPCNSRCVRSCDPASDKTLGFVSINSRVHCGSGNCRLIRYLVYPARPIAGTTFQSVRTPDPRCLFHQAREWRACRPRR